MAVVYGYLYILLTTITGIFEENYGFSAGSSGLTFLGLGIGMLFALIVCGVTSDWYLKKKAARGEMKPEYRLPLMIFGAVSLLIGLFLYGWTVKFHVHWIAPIIGTAFVGFGLITTMVPSETYLVDAFPLHSASALAGATVLRCFAGAVLSLAGPPLYNAVSYGWGNSILGFISLVFLPVPFLLMKFGERLRAAQSS